MLADVNGATLFYLNEGATRLKPPVVLMHGPGLDHTYFRPWLNPLAERHQLIYFDSRGNGRSSRSEAFSGLTIDTLVEDIEALRIHLELDQIILHGHSFAGCSALRYALKYGDHLAGLILDCTAPAFDYQQVMLANAAARATREQLEVLTNGLSGTITSDDEFRAVWKTVLPIYFHKYDEQIGKQMLARIQFSAAAFNHFGPLVLAANLLNRLPEIRTPTLILAGKHDWICPPTEGAERLHAGILDSRIEIFEESGHFPFVEDRDSYIRTVGLWLRDLTPGHWVNLG